MPDIFINRNIDDFMNKKSKKRNASFLPSTLFSLVIGPTGCGKSNVVLNLILGGYLEFTKLYVYSKTLDQDKMVFLQQNIAAAEKKTKKSIGSFFSDEAELPRPADLDKKEKNLILFDDVITEKQNGKIMSYFTQGRHNNANVLYLSQSFFKVPKNCIRENSNFIILFAGLNMTDIRNIWVAYSSDLSLKQFKKFYADGASNPHEFVVIDLTQPPAKRYKHGFNDVVDAKNF